MTTSTRTPDQRHAWDLTQVMSKASWLAKCLEAAREAARIPKKYATAADAFAHTTHRLAIPWDEHIPDGAFLWWTGGSKGAGHAGWKYHSKDGEPLIWSNQDVADGAFPIGGMRWVRLSTIELWYPRLIRAGISTDCDDVDTVPNPATVAA